MKVTYNRIAMVAMAVIGATGFGYGQSEMGEQHTLDPSNVPQITLNGNAVSFDDAQPGYVNGQLMVPVRAIAEQMGASVRWIHDTKEVVIDNHGQTVQLAATRQTWASNGDATRAQSMTNASQSVVLIGNRAYMPFSQLTTALNATSDWNGSGSTAAITFGNTNPTTTSPTETSPTDTGTSGTSTTGTGTDQGSGTGTSGSDDDK